jgi:hypothetical protein
VITRNWILLAYAPAALVFFISTVNSANLQSDDRRVLSAVAHTFCESVESGYAILDSSAGVPSDLGIEIQSLKLDQNLVQSLMDRNAHVPRVPSDADYGCLRLTDSALIKQAINSKLKRVHKGSEDIPQWEAFYEGFPGSHGVASFSLPAYSSVGDDAIVYVTYTCGSLCGTGSFYFLKRADGWWSVVKTTQMWIS